MSPNNFDHVSRGRVNLAVSFTVTSSGHGRVTEPESDQLSGRHLGIIPYPVHCHLSVLSHITIFKETVDMLGIILTEFR